MARARIAAAVRGWFAADGFVEVETPILQVTPGQEAHLHAFSTELLAPDGASRGTRLLHTSPEFAMKQLLVAGERRIFQLARCFRNREGSETHAPEFTMLEWYRVGADLDALAADLAGLLAAAARAAGARALTHAGRTADPFAPFQRLTVAEAFARWCGVDLMATLADPARPDPAPLRAACAAAGLPVRPDDGWEEAFFRLSVNRIEPWLGSPAPTLLVDWPAPLAALARPKPGDPRLVERAELYVAGLELANGFGELTDPVEQRRRFRAEQDRKQALYGARFPEDPEFFAALDHGLPESAGMALGFDRLTMLAVGAGSIAEVLWAPPP